MNFRNFHCCCVSLFRAATTIIAELSWNKFTRKIFSYVFDLTYFSKNVVAKLSKGSNFKQVELIRLNIKHFPHLGPYLLSVCYESKAGGPLPVLPTFKAFNGIFVIKHCIQTLIMFLKLHTKLTILPILRTMKPLSKKKV